MRARIIIAVISLAIGLFAGAKIMEHLGREYIVNNFPIPSGTLDDKDAYIKKIEIGLEVPEKKLKKVKDKAKNIILFIGDGMSMSQITALRLSQGGPNSRVAVDEFPYSGKVLTHSANAIVTDSASSGTAFSTGIKTNNRALGVDVSGNPVENITETLDKSIMLNAGRPLRTISLYELSDYIDTLQTAGIPVEKLRVQFHKTLALPLQLIGLALLAASFTLLTFSRQRRIRIIIMGLGVGFLYYFVSDLIFLLGHNSRLPAFVSGWLPAILIFTVSGFLLARGDEH